MSTMMLSVSVFKIEVYDCCVFFAIKFLQNKLLEPTGLAT